MAGWGIDAAVGIRSQSSAIIVADDDDLFRTRFARFVRANGHDAREARDGDEAMDLLAGGDADALLLDLVMPGALDGLGILAHLRKERRLGQLRVVVHSAYDGPAAEAARAIGASWVVRKPVAAPLLLHRLVGDLAVVAPPSAVFVVGAREDVRTRTVQGLRAAGLVPFAFVSGPDALAALRGAIPAVILMDASLAGGEGIELLHGVARLPHYVPVIALAGRSGAGPHQQLFDRVVHETVESDELAAIVRDVADANRPPE